MLGVWHAALVCCRSCAGDAAMYPIAAAVCVCVRVQLLPRLRSQRHVIPPVRHVVSLVRVVLCLWRVLRTILRFRFVRGAKVVATLWIVMAALTLKTWQGAARTSWVAVIRTLCRVEALSRQRHARFV